MTNCKVPIFNLTPCELFIFKLSVFWGSAITKLLAKLIFMCMLKPNELIAGLVLRNRVCRSFPLTGCFFGIGLLVFSKFKHEVVLDRLFWKKLFYPN